MAFHELDAIELSVRCSLMIPKARLSHSTTVMGLNSPLYGIGKSGLGSGNSSLRDSGTSFLSVTYCRRVT